MKGSMAALIRHVRERRGMRKGAKGSKKKQKKAGREQKGSREGAGRAMRDLRGQALLRSAGDQYSHQGGS